MSQNNPNNPQNTSTGGTTGGAGATGTGGTGSTSGGTTGTGGGGTGNTGLTPSTGGQGGGQGAGTATAPAQGLAAHAQEYGQRIAEAASHAKDYVVDTASSMGGRIKDLQNTDFNQVAEDAKQYARQNAGQAILISAAAGFLIGLLIRGSRR